MISNPNQYPTPESTPSTPELSADMSREDLVEYYGHQIDRAAALSDALGSDSDSWSEQDGFFKSGPTLNTLMERVSSDEHYVPSDTDRLLAQYIDADLNETTAFHSIDEAALLEKYKGQTDSVREAMSLHMSPVKEELIRHNNKIGAKLRTGTRIDPETVVPFNPERLLSKRDKRRLNGNKQDNTKIIGDVGAAERVLGNEGQKINAATFADLVARHAEGAIDDAALDLAKAKIEKRTIYLNRAADAYMIVAADNENDFKNDAFVEALDLDEDSARNQAISSQRKARAAANGSNNENTDSRDDRETDEFDAQGFREDLDDIERRLRGRLGLEDDISDDTEQPPAPSSTPDSSSADIHKQAIEDARRAAQSNFDEKLEELAQLKASKGADAQQLAAADNAFYEASYDLLQYDEKRKGVLTDSTLTLEQRSAMVNAYYMDRQAELRPAILGIQAEKYEMGVLAFTNRHAKKIKIAGYALAALTAATGNIPGAIAIGAATKSVTKAVGYNDKRTRAFNTTDTGESGTPSHINGQKSLDAMNAYILQHNSGPLNMEDIAKAAHEALMKECEDKFLEKHRSARRKRALGAVGVGAGWFTALMVGGNLGLHAITGDGFGGSIYDTVSKLSHTPLYPQQ